MEGNVKAVRLEGTDAAGKPASIPVTPVAGMTNSAPSYWVQCPQLLANTVVPLVVASIAPNPPTSKGELPKQLFAPRRERRSISVIGTYEENGKRQNVSFKQDLTRNSAPSSAGPKHAATQSTKKETAKPTDQANPCPPGLFACFTNNSDGNVAAWASVRGVSEIGVPGDGSMSLSPLHQPITTLPQSQPNEH